MQRKKFVGMRTQFHVPRWSNVPGVETLPVGGEARHVGARHAREERASKMAPETGSACALDPGGLDHTPPPLHVASDSRQ